MCRGPTTPLKDSLVLWVLMAHSFTPSLIHSYLLSTYYVPGMVQDAQDPARYQRQSPWLQDT